MLITPTTALSLNSGSPASQPSPNQPSTHNASCHPPLFTLVGNWKMYGSLDQLNQFAQNCLPSPARLWTLLCPPFVYLPQAVQALKNKGYSVGSQTCSTHNQPGPFTGQIQAAMLADVGCESVILGHPERRTWEHDDVLAGQIQAALSASLQPIVCLTDPGQLEGLHEALAALVQIPNPSPTLVSKGALAGPAGPKTDLCAPSETPPDQACPWSSPGHPCRQNTCYLSHCWLAFEPAVGAPCPPPDAIARLKDLRSQLPHQKILYGGGISPSTLGLVSPLVHGVLVGRASLDPQTWNQLIEACCQQIPGLTH